MVATVSCPTCRRPICIEQEHRPKTFPFCSARCRLIDLGAWANGDYQIAGKDVFSAYDSDSTDTPEQRGG
jgi:uncharacterized protein